ncbi:paramyosin-like isoform X1 [Acanthopagrus latus]|uniref:paramyosin-like isoform X1 n=1 Tax=Acanthopagrus latus TaxID=8177 RepID=UPI00187C75F4|nr:paramyosin-like isoform X1 [Acanthopagrus latus]
MSQQRLLQQLEDTKEQLKKQKTLKEMYIRRGEETTRELERLRKSSNDVKLSNAKIATQERDNTRQKKKKDLHKDHEELQVAHLITEEKNQADLQAEKHKNKLLLDELDQISVSHNEIRLSYQTDVMKVRQQLDTLQHDLVKEMQQRTTVEKQNAQLQMAHVLSQDNFTAELQVEEQKNKLLQDKLDRISHGYETGVNTVRQQADTLQQELETDVKSHSDTVVKGLQMITNLSTEQDDLHHRMTEEINKVQQNNLEKEERYDRHLEELKTQFTIQISLNLELSTQLKILKDTKNNKNTSTADSHLSEHLCFRCPPSSVWLQCHRQSAPSLRQARGADSRGGTVCHICYSCHQLQEAPHKWSGLRSSRGRPVSSHRNVQLCRSLMVHSLQLSLPPPSFFPPVFSFRIPSDGPGGPLGPSSSPDSCCLTY